MQKRSHIRVSVANDKPNAEIPKFSWFTGLLAVPKLHCDALGPMAHSLGFAGLRNKIKGNNEKNTQCVSLTFSL